MGCLSFASARGPPQRELGRCTTARRSFAIGVFLPINSILPPKQLLRPPYMLAASAIPLESEQNSGVPGISISFAHVLYASPDIAHQVVVLVKIVMDTDPEA